MPYTVNILSEVAFTQHPLKNSLINSFIHWEKFSRGKYLLDFLVKFEEPNPVINSSMQQPQKLLPVIYCATYFEAALLVDGFSVLFHYSFFEKYS